METKSTEKLQKPSLLNLLNHKRARMMTLLICGSDCRLTLVVLVYTRFVLVAKLEKEEYQELWDDLFANPGNWYDNRANKVRQSELPTNPCSISAADTHICRPELSIKVRSKPAKWMSDSTRRICKFSGHHLCRHYMGSQSWFGVEIHGTCAQNGSIR
jgi:hypothetical protein